MLVIEVGGEEFFNEETQEFTTVGSTEVELEHSLVSLSKWESKWQIPFMGDQEKTDEMLLDYIKCMILTPGDPDEIVAQFSQSNVTEIQDYIQSPQTATTFGKEKPGSTRGPKEIITAELIYYWMTAFQIPFECQHWHLNRLFTLIRVANVKNSKTEKMPRHEQARQYRDLNEERKRKLGTKG